MPRKLVDAERSKAIVNHAWDRVRARTAVSPTWNYMATAQLVDTLLADNPSLDGRDIGDALVLCHELGETPTKVAVRKNMGRVERGRQANAGYR